MNYNENSLAPSHEEGRVISAYDFGLGQEEAEYMNASEPHPNFIESPNSCEISLQELITKCTTPTFSTGDLTISTPNFIQVLMSCANNVFGELTPVEIRVSHKINQRRPEFVHLKNSEIQEEHLVHYWQRAAFLAHIPSLTRTIAGHEVQLTVGGCRNYSDESLFKGPSPMKFHAFVAWTCRICDNCMITCDGNSGVLEAMTEADLYQKIYQLFTSFNLYKENNLYLLDNLTNTRISEEVFCHIIGRLRLYQFLPNEAKSELPPVILGDQILNSSVKLYATSNSAFGKQEDGTISCFDLMNILNEATKSSYIDKWIQRNQNCTDFSIGIQKALTGDPAGACYRWFLQ